jgi:hypothetical protein
MSIGKSANWVYLTPITHTNKFIHVMFNELYDEGVHKNKESL